MAAKKRGKAKARRKTQKKLNLVGVAESVIIANVVTEGLFNCNAYQFITGRGATAGFDGYMPYNTDSIITLPELLNFKYDRLQNSSGNTPQMVGFKSSGAGQVIKDNLKANAMDMTFKLVTIPIAFKVVTNSKHREPLGPVVVLLPLQSELMQMVNQLHISFNQ